MQLIERLKAEGHSCDDCAWSEANCYNPGMKCKEEGEICEWYWNDDEYEKQKCKK